MLHPFFARSPIAFKRPTRPYERAHGGYSIPCRCRAIKGPAARYAALRALDSPSPARCVSIKPWAAAGGARVAARVACFPLGLLLLT